MTSQHAFLPRWLIADNERAPARAGLLRRWVALGALTLIAVTWQLWTPQTVYPQVPLLATLVRLPLAVQWPLTGLLVISALVVLFGNSRSELPRRALLTMVMSFALLALFDQHRLQPWAYQFSLIAVVLIFCPAEAALPWIRLFVVGIYFHSALSKCDALFAAGPGQQFAGALAGLAGLDFANWPAGARTALAWLFPLGELAVAVMLLVPRWWRWGVLASLVMHLGLFAILGPWGLAHKPGVLVWNLWFAAQNILLFPPPRLVRTQPDPVPEPHVRVVLDGRGNWCGWLMTLAILWPLGVDFGWCDEWLAWGLYSARAERARLLVHQLEHEKLPESLRPYIVENRDDPTETWMELRLDRWSLDALRAPIYPQARFQIGVAGAVVRTLGLERVLLVEQHRANRWTGERQQEEFSGAAEISTVAEKYWLGARGKWDGPKSVVR